MAFDLDLDWGDLAEKVIGLGAPILGGALGGPLGAAAGKLLADALGAAQPTPASVNAVLTGPAVDPTVAIEAAQKAESEWLAALAEVGKAEVTETGATARAEIASDDRLQRWWRPIYALELSMFECPAFAVTLLHALWMGDTPAINGFANLSAMLMTYFGARFGVLPGKAGDRNGRAAILADPRRGQSGGQEEVIEAFMPGSPADS
jgi:hypothetical protein